MADVGAAADELAKAADEYAKARAAEEEAQKAAREAFDRIYGQAEGWSAETATAETQAYHNGPEKKLREAEKKREEAEKRLQRAIAAFWEAVSQAMFGH